MIEQTNVGVLQEAVNWAVDLYEQRTVQVARGLADIIIAHPAYRVTWDEIVRQFPILRDEHKQREFWVAWDGELRRRGLWGVVKGRLTARDWLRRQGLE